MSSLKKKLASRAGESIGETLFALLIAALALMMLAGAVSSGMRVVNNSKAALDAYYKVNNALVTRAASAPADAKVTEGAFSGALNLKMPGLDADGQVSVNYWKNEQLSGIPVIAYTYKKTI